MIHWNDACSQYGQLAAKELHPECPNFTAGILLSKNSRYVTIAHNHIPDNRRPFSDVTHIPRKTIVSMKTWRYKI